LFAVLLRFKDWRRAEHTYNTRVTRVTQFTDGTKNIRLKRLAKYLKKNSVIIYGNSCGAEKDTVGGRS
jgi:oligoribonuclease (3'-5' exoribonuclease)